MESELVRRFEDLSAALLRKVGYLVERPQGVVPVDFIAKKDGTSHAVECKFYRARPAPSLVMNAITMLHVAQERSGASGAILMMSVPCPGSIRRLASREWVAVWDLDKLVEEAGSDQALLAELEAIVREGGVGSRDNRSLSLSVVQTSDSSSPSWGTHLVKELHECPMGREGAKRFEKLCTEALRFLFGDNFGTWNEQQTIESGFQFMDVVARLRPIHEFWVAVARDFRTRYVVFEFKNYSNQITQAQIFTTEKYLFTTALRSVAIIIARAGADDGAHKAAVGSLRESGKLVLLLSLTDLENMLTDRESGSDPNNLLVDRLDAMLLGMGR